jgi:hypothetical protein
MSMVQLVGEGFWYPPLPEGISGDNSVSSSDVLLLDADEEEAQLIGRIQLDGGGSKTFGTSGSKIGWLPGPTLTFAASSTLRIGVKSAAKVDTVNGPPARATVGAAAFDVYRSLVGGTDTVTATTWREDTMNAGTPFTVTHGDFLAICLHLDTTAGTPNMKMRCAAAATKAGLPSSTLVTNLGTVFTSQTVLPNVMLTFDDGTLGWLPLSYIFSVIDAGASSMGLNNIQGNVFRVPFACEIDSLAAYVSLLSNTRDFALQLYGTPLGTPSLLASVTYEANIQATTGGLVTAPLPSPVALTPGTDYLVGVKQTTANGVNVTQRDVPDAAYFKPSGMGAECYAANSTAGATFVAQNSGRRRYLVWVQVSALDNGAGAGLLQSRVPRRQALRFVRSTA